MNIVRIVSVSKNFYSRGNGILTLEINGILCVGYVTSRLDQEKEKRYTEYYISLHDEYNPSAEIFISKKSISSFKKEIEKYPNKLIYKI